MVAPNINEVSGVDHPAHLMEGWLAIQKSSGDVSPEMAALLGRAEALSKGVDLSTLSVDPDKGASTMPTETETATTAETDAAAFEKAIANLPEEVRKGLLANQRRAIEAESLAKALLDERETTRFEAIAKELIHLPGVDSNSDEQSFAKTLRSVAAGTTPDQFDGLLKVLRAADGTIAKSAAFGEIGSDSPGSAPGSAGGSIEAIAKALVEADTTGELTHAAAVAKAAMDNPELYTQHRTETLRRNQEA